MQWQQVPQHLRDAYDGWASTDHYSHDPAVTTFRLDHPDGRVRFLKLGEATSFPAVRDEAERMVWAARHLPVPIIVESDSDGIVDWLLTEQIAGVDATDPALPREPERLVPLLAEGLRQFHSAPVADCPFDSCLDVALALARSRVGAGLVKVSDFHDEHRELTVEGGLAVLEAERPPDDQLVVCHGDYCFPNVIIDDWRVRGFIDLGELAVADRWWDLAVASWSTIWNIGAGWEDAFIEAYGLQSDRERIRYYRLLYDYVA